jgi:hypothetical protein
MIIEMIVSFFFKLEFIEDNFVNLTFKSFFYKYKN